MSSSFGSTEIFESPGLRGSVGAYPSTQIYTSPSDTSGGNGAAPGRRDSVATQHTQFTVLTDTSGEFGKADDPNHRRSFFSSAYGSMMSNKKERGLTAEQLWPIAFSMMCVCTFMGPSFYLWQLISRPDFSYWVRGPGEYYWMFFIPLIIFITHCIHSVTGKPNRLAVVISLVVPSLILILYSYTLPALSAHFFSTDCQTFEDKVQLQRSWNAASAFFEKCLKATSDSSSKYSIAHIRANFRIHDCEGYALQEKKYGADWVYLRHLEEHSFCNGWCAPAAPLWSFVERKTSCSFYVGALFQTKVEPCRDEVFYLMLFTLAFSVLVLILAGPMIRSKGYTW